MYDLGWQDDASKELNKLDNFIAQIIIKKVEELKENPLSKDVKRLVGRKEYRLRVGDYGVIFEIINNLILIKKIGHRRHIYDF